MVPDRRQAGRLARHHYGCMLADVVPFLVCPHCAARLVLANGSVRCGTGHVFDIARQGYVSLLPGDAQTGTADTAEMVQAREEFLAGGHYSALARTVATCASSVIDGLPDGGCVLDVGAGTGYHLAHVLNRLPGRTGVAADISKYALRRAARAHRRIGAVACDAWRPLPVRHDAAVLALSIFAPRNGPELHRVLQPTGALLVATPTARHLAELIPALGLLTVDEYKQDRLAEKLNPHFDFAEQHRHEHALSLAHKDVAAVAAMGPSAWHLEPDVVQRRLDRLPEPLSVTTSVMLSLYRPAPV